MEESPRFKLIIGIIVVAAVLAISIAVTYGMGSNASQGPSAAGLWTPPPSSTPSPTTTLSPGQTRLPALTSTATPTLDPATNCTRPALYWASHTDLWPVRVIIGEFVYTKEQAVAFSSQPGDAAADLFVQLNAAYLNASYGADYRAVNDTILAAASWLKTYPPGSALSPSDQEAGLALQMALKDYNEGRILPGLCAIDSTPRPSPTPQPSSTLAFTETPTETPPFGVATITVLVSTIQPPANTPRPIPTVTVYFPPTRTPSATPIGTQRSPTPRPSFTPTFMRTPTLAPTTTPVPSSTQTPPTPPTPVDTSTPQPTIPPAPTDTAVPVPTIPPPPTDTPVPPSTAPPANTNTPGPTHTPKPTRTPRPT